MTTEFCALRIEDDVLMCTAEQTLVLIDPEHRRPVPIPDDYREALEGFEGADLDLAVAR